VKTEDEWRRHAVLGRPFGRPDGESGARNHKRMCALVPLVIAGTALSVAREARHGVATARLISVAPFLRVDPFLPSPPFTCSAPNPALAPEPPC
jgi:hypothetical protein